MLGSELGTRTTDVTQLWSVFLRSPKLVGTEVSARVLLESQMDAGLGSQENPQGAEGREGFLLTRWLGAEDDIRGEP